MGELYLLMVVLLIVISSPLQVIAALLIFIDSGRPIFYLQRRVGFKGKSFEIWKFRTMTVDADRQKQSLLKYNEANGPVFKIRDDPRFTRVGKFLAHTGLDELPQLWNVLRGDMALIGPRPLPMAEVKKLKAWQLKRHDIKPGIISPWIIEGYHRQPFDAWMKSDIAYSKKKNFSYDLSLATKTFILLASLFVHELVS